MKPLSGTKVVDVTQNVAGPFCTQNLADLGADVIKIEPLAGDGTRSWGPPFWESDSVMYLAFNRNKKSVALNLRGELRRRFPRLICCEMRAFGPEGPLAEEPGFDPVLQAMSGLMSITGEASGAPVRAGTSIVDLGLGLWATVGILAALTQRERRERGRSYRRRCSRPLSRGCPIKPSITRRRVRRRPGGDRNSRCCVPTVLVGPGTRCL